MNAGQIENKGIEIQVSATPFKGDFSWETTLSRSKNNNKSLSLANNQNQLANASAGTKWVNVMRNYVGPVSYTHLDVYKRQSKYLSSYT